mmetsp:Transcript_30469/g.78778  ORF Transcript_30469/g.78778 Transcript_30469/m.78778 type:complete len:108 (+) Transcript_30469:1299-1622(+)
MIPSQEWRSILTPVLDGLHQLLSAVLNDKILAVRLHCQQDNDDLFVDGEVESAFVETEFKCVAAGSQVERRQSIGAAERSSTAMLLTSALLPSVGVEFAPKPRESDG